ncbi:MAG: SafA/ExsA family spore coat assembly protein [Paenisporosarcina sp.]
MHVHVVQKGDTLWKISRQYGVSFDEVKRLNAHLANPDYIVPGMKIFVPETAKTQEVKEHPYQDGRPVKSKKEEMIVQPVPKAMPQPIPKAVTQPAPSPAPIPQPQPMPMPPVMQQPTPQPIPLPYPYPFTQDISMTNIVPQMVSVPYGWMPIPDMDTHHMPQPMPKKHKTLPIVSAPVVPAPPPPAPAPIPGWKFHDSSSLKDMDSSSLHHPVLPEQVQHYQPSPTEGYGPCGCGQPAYTRPMQMPMPMPTCGCGRQQMAYAMPDMAYGNDMDESNDSPTQTVGAYQEPSMMMAHHPYMPGPQMSPYMACTPCHMWPAPHGHWGYHFPGRHR